MARLLRFEPFDAHPAPESQGPSEDWRAGHAQGLADAAAAALAREATATEAALAALGDLAFTWAEARGAVLAGLAPLFRAMADRLLPDLAREAFVLHLVEELGRVAATDLPPVPRVALAPVDAARLAPLLGPGMCLVADPTLAPGQARIACGDGGTALDMPALVTALQEVVAAFLAEADPSTTSTTEGQLAHG